MYLKCRLQYRDTRASAKELVWGTGNLGGEKFPVPSVPVSAGGHFCSLRLSERLGFGDQCPRFRCQPVARRVMHRSPFLYNFLKFKKRKKNFDWIFLISLIYRNFFSYYWTRGGGRGEGGENEHWTVQNLLKGSSFFYPTPVKSGSSDHTNKAKQLSESEGWACQDQTSPKDLSKWFRLPHPAFTAKRPLHPSLGNKAKLLGTSLFLTEDKAMRRETDRG